MRRVALAACLAGACNPGGDPEPVWEAPLAPTPLRRLTPLQYNLTVRDLFSGVDVPEQRFPTPWTGTGFDGNAVDQTPNALYVEAVQQAAVAVSSAAMADPDGWLPCGASGGPDPVGCGAAFVLDFGRRVFRRPLSPVEVSDFVGFFLEELAASDFDTAVQLVLQAMLGSPQFLYRLELGSPADPPWTRVPLDDHQMASRLSYTLWNTMPDATLFAAADAGTLRTPAQIEAQAERMLDDPRAADLVVDFHAQWLDLDEVDRLNLSPDFYPQFTPEMNPSLRREVEDLVLRVWFAEEPTLEALLLDDRTDVDWALSLVYGVPEGTDRVPPTHGGLLTRPAWLASNSQIATPSPVLRGVWVLERMLCTPPSPPPANVTLDGLLFGQSTGTNRDRYAAHVADPACAGCHSLIDPLGFGFEHYDAIGAYRELDNGLPVDATGEVSLDGDLASFDGALELSALLAQSAEVRSCYARHWFRFGAGRVEDPQDGVTLDRVLDAAEGGDMRAILFGLVRSEWFRTRLADH